jgi:DNA-binding winged helix-turn-helix (wHTH) protein/tetratricopeptide (TPR) repeat protein
METPRFFQFPLTHPAHTTPEHGPERYNFGPFTLDVERHLLTGAGLPIALQPKSFDLLCLFLKSNGAVLPKDQLMRALWPDTFVEEANLSNLIALLRKLLGDSPSRSQYIQTVPKVGYRFAAPVNAETRTFDAPSAPPAPQPQTGIRIIVFPFRVNTGVPDQEHLAYSLPEAISSSLAELNAFTVRSMQSAMRFDPVRWDPRAVGSDAEVEYILAGAIAPGDAGISVSTQLIGTADGTLVWSQQWQVNEADVAMVHHAVLHHVVRRLVRAGADSTYSSGQVGMPADSEATRMYLVANQLMTRRDYDNFALARDLYVACVERDPTFAPAWARLGRCYRWFEKFGSGSEAPAQTAQMAFERAFALNPNLVLAHSLYTPVEADAGGAEHAMVRLLRRVRSHRNSPELFTALVHACRYCGQLDSSVAAHRRALQLDSRVRTSVAHSYFALGDYDRALFWYGHREGVYLDALILATTGRTHEAAALLSTRKERFSMMPEAMHSLDAYLRGDRGTGIEVLRHAAGRQNFDPEALYYLARQAAEIGEVDLGNQFLARSIAGGYWTLAALQRDPWLQALRTTNRFAELLSQVEALEARSREAFFGAEGDEVLTLDSECDVEEAGRLA